MCHLFLWMDSVTVAPPTAGRAQAVGMLRTCILSNGLVLEEEIVDWQPPHGYAYRGIDATHPFGLRVHLGVLSFAPVSNETPTEQGCRFVWQQYFDHNNVPAMRKQLEQSMAAAISSLIRQFGGCSLVKESKPSKCLGAQYDNFNKFPVWFTALTTLFFISNLFVFGIASLVNPSLPFPDVGQTAAFPIQFFAIRHIAFAFPLLYGLVRRDVKILTVMYSIFIVMSALDIALLAIYGYYIPILGLLPFVEHLPTIGTVVLGVGAFLVPVGAGLWFLTSQSKQEGALRSRET